MLPMAVPGLVLGLGYVFFVNAKWNPLGFLYGTLLVLVINSIAHFYTVAHITSLTALKQIDPEFESVSASLKVPFWRTFAPRHRADLHAVDPRHRGLYLRQRADHRVGGDLPLRPGHQARRDRDRAHGRDGRDRGRRRHGDHDRARPRSAPSCCRSCSTACCSCACRPGGGDDARTLCRDTAPPNPKATPTCRRSGAPGPSKNLDPEARTLLAEDEKYFLRQSVSTPCLNAIVKAEGIWIEDTAGRRYMDFHGNNVHHIGYGHPRLKRAIAEQMDALPFAPRRYTCGPAVALAAKLAEIAPGNLSKVLFTTGGSDAVEVAIKIARAATGRYKTLSFWDAFHGAGFGAAAVGGEALFRSGGVGPLMPGAEHVAPYAALSLSLWHVDHRRERGRLRAHDRIRAGARRRHRGLHRRADARGAAHSAARLLAPRAHGLRPPRHAADLRRDPDRARQDRQDVRLRSTTAWCRTSWCSARRSAAASCRSPRCSRGPSSTSARPTRSATTRTRRTR